MAPFDELAGGVWVGPDAAAPFVLAAPSPRVRWLATCCPVTRRPAASEEPFALAVALVSVAECAGVALNSTRPGRREVARGRRRHRVVGRAERDRWPTAAFVPVASPSAFVVTGEPLSMARAAKLPLSRASRTEPTVALV